MKPFLIALLCLSVPGFAAETGGIQPRAADGRPLNLDFEEGTLRDWKTEGTAFQKQPVKGDTVSPRRSDMKSGHEGNYWVGTFEVGGDDLTGRLTSVPFKVTHPYASFRVAGGPWPATRVELVREDTGKPFFKVSGYESETLRPVVVDLHEQLGKNIFIRIVDEQKGHWGHINFDAFKFYAARPGFEDELKPAELTQQNQIPEADQILNAGLSPEDAVKKMSMPDGFSATLFAGEPEVKQPIAFALDDRGRLWVAEAYTYPVRAAEGQGKDRILVFEDTDGDGKFDRRTVFMEGLNLVSGLEVGFGGVWVGAAPYLMFIPVADGDSPKPAGEPRILLDGWDYKRDTHETLNTFTWGPDGWLYGCHGVFCPSFVGKPGTQGKDRQRVDAGVWRYHPTKHRFEVFAEGTSNPWGVDFDSNGQCIIEACVIPHLWHMIQGARYERQGGQHYNIDRDEQRSHERFAGSAPNYINPFIFDDIKTIADHVHYAGNKGPHAGNGRSDKAGGGHAHAGLMIYQGESWPQEYRGHAFMNNIHGARINQDVLERKGSGFVGHHAPDFILFNDSWSQILNLQADQDGSVYMIDWYDKNQCHHNRVDGHDRSNGRIFKVKYRGQKMTTIDLARKSDVELVALQTSKNEFLVRHSRRLLQERSGSSRETIVPRLVDLLHKAQGSREKLRLLWALHACGGLTEPIVDEMLKDREEYVRGWAIQLALEDREISGKLMERLAGLAQSESSAVVRLYLASAAQRLTGPNRWPVLAALASHGEDASDHNLPLMFWYAYEPLIEQDLVKAFGFARSVKFPHILNFTVRRVAAIGTPAAFAAITTALNNLLDEKQELDALNAFALALKGRRNVPMPENWRVVEEKFTKSSNPEIRAQGLALSLIFGSKNALAALRSTVLDGGADPAARRTALDSLIVSKDEGLTALLQDLLGDDKLRGAALRGLAGLEDSKTPGRIVAVYGKLNGVEKRDALNTLASRSTYAVALLDAIGQGKIGKSELTAELVRQLRSLKNPEVAQRMASVWGVARESSADKRKQIDKYRRVYSAGGSQPGDASRGRLVFSKVCQQCHTLFETGGRVGPDLTGSNRADLDYILENIVDPNAVIPNEYRSSTLETRDDRIITGIVKEQDDTKVTMMTANETLVIPKTEIKLLHQNELSMMPEGLLDPLTDQEVRDLLYYLSRPAQVNLPEIATGNR